MREGEPSAENGCGVRGKSKDDIKKEKKSLGRQGETENKGARGKYLMTCCM